MTSPAEPQSWRLVPVSNLISISHGFAFKGELFIEHGRDALITPGNFLESGGFRHTGRRQRYYGGNFPDTYRLNEGDLIIAMTEQTEGLIGSAAFVPGAGRWLHNQRVGRVYIKSEEVLPNYLFYVFNSFEFRQSVAETATGTKVKHTSPSKLGAIEIRLPSKTEQERITEKLNDVDAMILGIERLIEKRQAIKQGMMQQLLTGKTRLPGFTARWAKGTFEQLATPSMERVVPRDVPPTTPLVELEQLEGGSGRLIGTSQASKAVSLKSVFKPGDVLFGKLRAYLKKFWYADTGGLCTTEIWVLRAKPGIHGRFVRYVVETEKFIETASGGYGTHMPRSDWGTVRTLSVSIPPEREQIAIASVLAEMDDEIDLLNCRLTKARETKTGMMQQLLTGRTRLPPKEAVP